MADIDEVFEGTCTSEVPIDDYSIDAHALEQDGVGHEGHQSDVGPLASHYWLQKEEARAWHQALVACLNVEARQAEEEGVRAVVIQGSIEQCALSVLVSHL